MRTLSTHAPPDFLMTAVPQSTASIALPSPFARAMAFLAYFLLLAALPTFGSSALLAVIFAYARRDGATPLIRSHHRFQIQVFWIGLALAVAAIALATSAWIDTMRPLPRPFHIPRSPDAQLIAFHPGQEDLHAQPEAFHSYSWSYAGAHARAQGIRTRALLEGYGAMVSVAFAGLWGILAPLWGLVRLASGRPMGHSPN
jgi:hypothetical protein